MGKPLIKSQPSSSVAGMLEAGIGAKALSKPVEVRSIVLPTPIGEQLPSIVSEQPKADPLPEIEIIPRQFTLTASSDKVLKTVVSLYSEATGLDLKHSEFLRSVLIAVDHAMPELKREAQSIGRLKRPKNDRAKKAIRDQMERRIAKALVAGMRAVAALE